MVLVRRENELSPGTSLLLVYLKGRTPGRQTVCRQLSRVIDSERVGDEQKGVFFVRERGP
jgi:hypothetical protein